MTGIIIHTKHIAPVVHAAGVHVKPRKGMGPITRRNLRAYIAMTAALMREVQAK